MDKSCCGNCFYSKVANEEAVFCEWGPPNVYRVEGTTIFSASPLISKDWKCGQWKPKVKVNDAVGIAEGDHPGAIPIGIGRKRRKQ